MEILDKKKHIYANALDIIGNKNFSSMVRQAHHERNPLRTYFR